MATQENVECVSKKANADLTGKKYYVVKLSAAQTVDLCSAITDKAFGVLQDEPKAAGRDCSVAIGGTSKVVAGAAITAGAYVACTAAGKVQTAVSTQYPIGQALDAAAADLDIIEIKLIAGGVPLP